MNIVEAAEILNEAVGKTVKNLVDKGDRKGIKYIFVDALDVDPTFVRYEDDYQYCKSKGFLDPHEELTPFTSDKSKWDEDYWTKLKMDLLKNFSDKRMQHMKEVAKVFLAEKVDRILKERKAKEEEEKKKKAKEEEAKKKAAKPTLTTPKNISEEDKRRYDYLNRRIVENDPSMLRESLGSMIYGCRDFSDGEFDGAVRYVEAHGIKLKEPYDGKELVSDSKPESEWTDDDFAVAIARLKRNFCDERINDVKKIGKKLYSKNAPKTSSEAKPSTSTPSKPEKNAAETVKIRTMLKRLMNDLWELIKSLGSRNFATIRGKWQTLCRNFVRNARNTAIGKKLAKVFNKTPETTEEAKGQLNAVKAEVNNLNEAAAIVKAATILSEEYQTNKSSVFQENQPESKTPYVHRVEYNWYDPNLMDLKRLPSDEDQDSVTEPS